MIKLRSLNSFYTVLDYIFPLYFVVSFVEFYFGLWGLPLSVKLLCMLLILLYMPRILRNANDNVFFFQIFTIYYVYCIASLFNYLFNGIPIKCYLNEIYNSIPAMFFVYVGMAEKRQGMKFYDVFLKFCTLSMLIGLALYITTPGWYLARRAEIASNTWYTNNLNYTEEDVLSNMRFTSYLYDTYEVDMYAMIGLSIALFVFFCYNNRKSIYGIIIILINLAAAFLTQQRVAMAASVCVVLFYVFYGIKKGKKQSYHLVWFVLLFLIVGITMAVTFWGDRVDMLTEMLSDRMDNMSLSKAMKERDYQYDLITKYWTMPIFGHGLGSGGAIAGQLHFPHVYDAAYLELLYETGIVGFSLFLMIIVKTLIRGVKYMKYYLIELVIIAFVLTAMIGSNTLTMGLITIFPFWYSIGRIWNKNHFIDAKLNKDYI